MTTKVQQFLQRHPVFTRETFELALSQGGTKNANTLKNILAQHIQRGHITRIRRGLFAAVPYGADPEMHPINPYLIARFLTDDAVVAYHTALAFYGCSYSASYRFTYLTKYQTKSLTFRGDTYQGTQFPTALVKKNRIHYYVNTEDVQGLDIQVTSKERTFVDVMDRPILGGGWEEIWRSLDMIERFRQEYIVDYARTLGNATTNAKVGFYLEQRKTDLKVADEVLEKLMENRPASPHYMDNAFRGNSKYIAHWNLMVPLPLIHREWEEDLEWEPKP